MDRRQFVDWMIRSSALAAATPLLSAAPGAGRKLIIPSDNPDRFKLKVMEFNPVAAPDPGTWALKIGGLANRPLVLKAADLKRFSQVTQSSRLKCVQCWSARIEWGGFRCG